MENEKIKYSNLPREKRKVLFSSNIDLDLYIKAKEIAEKEKITFTSFLNRIINTYIICYDKIENYQENVIGKNIVKEKKRGRK